MKCNICNSKMNIYRLPETRFRSRISIAVGKVGTAVCPRCYNLIDLPRDEEVEKGFKITG